jgi:hypothetical protein
MLNSSWLMKAYSSTSIFNNYINYGRLRVRRPKLASTAGGGVQSGIRGIGGFL